MMVQATDLISMLIGLETMSLAVYALTSQHTNSSLIAAWGNTESPMAGPSSQPVTAKVIAA